MNAATMAGMRMIAEAMTGTDNFAVQIEVDGKFQTVIDRLTEAEAEAKELAGRWESSRIVKVQARLHFV